MKGIVRDHHALSSFEPRPLAAKIGPSLNSVEVFANTDSNVSKALRKRFVDKFIPYMLDIEDERKIRRVVKMIIKTFFPRDEVRSWLADHPLLVELKSSTMDYGKFETALDELLSCCGVLPEYKYMIKQEIMPLEKKPRIIINAGDLHQLSALLVISCFEHFWFSHDATDHIKHAPKLESLHRVIGNLRMASTKDAETAEGDGSSWDFCQSLKIRELIENPILRHIGECLYGVTRDMPNPHSWAGDLPFHAAFASLDFRTLKKWVVKPSGNVIDFKVGSRHKFQCDAVRPSGERGTSCLNHLVNCVLWASVLLELPEELFSSKSRDATKSRTYKLSSSLFKPVYQIYDPCHPKNNNVSFVDQPVDWKCPVTHLPKSSFERTMVGGRSCWVAEDSYDTKRWKAKCREKLPRVSYRGVFEGDDSLVVTDKWVWDRLDCELRSAWTKAGFDMKIIRQGHADKRGSVTFTGYEILCEGGLPTHIFIPSLPRNVMNAAFTVSPYALTAGNFCGKDQRTRIHEVGAQAMYARAAAYAPHLPYISVYFREQAEYHQSALRSLRDAKRGIDEMTILDTSDWSTAHRFGVELGDVVHIGEVMNNAEALYRPLLEPLYDELVWRTTGHKPNSEDKTGLILLHEVSPDDEYHIRARLPPAFYGA